MQEALLVAAQRWPEDGVPEHPRAWLVRTATRRMVDAWRSESSRRRRELAALMAEPVGGTAPSADDSLVLLYLCAHPALTPASAIALTLRAVGGLSTAEIAAAFFVPEATMAQRISRAKARIAASGVGFTMPEPAERTERQRAVLHVLYLMFTEGHTSAGGGELNRVELSEEAIRLTRLALAAGDGDADQREVGALLALMLLTDARRPARTDDAGDIVPMAQQDRRRWNHSRIAEGLALLERAAAEPGPPGEYELQAEIAAIHARAARPEDTDWPRILDVYEALEEMTGSGVVTLNRAVAAAMAHGPAAGLAVLDAAAPAVAQLARYDVVRGHLLERAGRVTEAREAFRSAASHATNAAERRYLVAHLAGLGEAAT